MSCKETTYLGNCQRHIRTPETAKRTSLTKNSKEITETKLYKTATSQVIHGALNNLLGQYCL